MSYERIACLSTEAVETLYLLGAEEKIVGISGFTVHPPRARREKPKISGFSSAKLQRILAVKPDLVIGFSELQSEIMRDLLHHGVEVHVFNQRDVAGILRMIDSLGALAGRAREAGELVEKLQKAVMLAKDQASRVSRRARVYFEEWNEPMICGIRWVSELITIAGGDDCFADLALHCAARDRIISDPAEVVRRAPEIIIGSWCGKRFVPAQVSARAGWDVIPAVASGRVHEIKSADILSPGPGVLTRGLPKLMALIQEPA